MGKMKVHEIAKELNLKNEEVLEMLKKMGVEAKSHLAAIDEDVVQKLRASKKGKDSNKNAIRESKDDNPHIIRRKVKVISTDDEGNEVENITTKAGNVIQRSSVVHESKNNKDAYSKEGLGVVKSNYSKNNLYGQRNRVNNIVVTKNGKPIETPEPSKTQTVESAVENTVEKETINVDRQYNNSRNDDNRNNYRNSDSRNERTDRRPYNNENNNNYNKNNNYNNGNRSYNNNENGRPQFNRQNGTNNAGNNQYNNRNDRRPYNNSNNGENRPYNNNGQGSRPYNNNGQDSRPYNNNSQGSRPYNNNGQSSRPYNNNYNGNRPQFNRQNGNNTEYKVNQFIKEASSVPILEKETRDYSTVLIDKKKNTTDKNSESKKEKLNKNQIREADTRIEFNKFRGMQVDSSSEGIMEFYDRGNLSRKYGNKKKSKAKEQMQHTKIIPLTEVRLPEAMTVKYFAEIIKTQASDIIKKLFGLGIMATVNQEIDFDTAFLIASEIGIEAKKEVVVTEEDILFDDSEDDESCMKPRPPIVTVMGHVDHGKTSLLDRIREANVVSGEAGGITQHIGAYKVKVNDKEITFLDTPGHAAFTEMRARGAQVTDIVIIVVAADDGIKPQTKEAISHAKAADVSIIVAINKIDKPEANVEKVKRELLEEGLVAEEWGGDTIIVPVSAKTGEGLDNLLEMVLLVADVKDFKADPKKQSKGTVIEARLDKSKGTIASVLVQRGTLNIGDTIVVGDIIGKIRNMVNDKGEKIKKAGPSTPVEILGLPTVPETGEIFYEVKDEKTAHKLIEKRKAKVRTDLIKHGNALTLDDLFSQIKEGNLKDLNLIIKADVQGSVEAIKDSLVKLSNDEVRIRVIHSGAGGINESDVTLAKVSNAIIIGFNVRPDSMAASIAEKEKVDMRLYRVIYDAINDVEAAMKGMLAPTFKEVQLGTAEVRMVFKASNIGTIAGSYIKSGKFVRNAQVRIVRDSVVVHDGKIESIKREKDDVKEIAEGYECGIKIEGFNDIKELDILECYEMQEQKK